MSNGILRFYGTDIDMFDPEPEINEELIDKDLRASYLYVIPRSKKESVMIMHGGIGYII